MSSDDIIGWDIGGAHLKASRVSATGAVIDAMQVPCALWRGMDELDRAFDQVLAKQKDIRQHVVTMTGEMVDFFPDRASGVKAIAEFVANLLGGANVRFYKGDGEFVMLDQVCTYAAQIASANWRATAECVALKISDGLLVDMGSTTTDIIPIVAHRVRNQGHNDATRLVTEELVYTGLTRTPLMAMAERVPFAGETVPLVAEYFATMADVYRLAGELQECDDQHPAADNGEKTSSASATRLARMLGRDHASAPMADWRALACWFRARQFARLSAACERVATAANLPLSATIVGAGVGQFLLREIATKTNRNYIEFVDLLSVKNLTKGVVSNVAPAVAVALLAKRG